MLQNNTLSLKGTVKSMTSNSSNSNTIGSGFSSQSDFGQEKTTSVISRPPPGLLGYGAASTFSTNSVEFNDELLEERFEYYFYKRTRASEFSWIGNN